jgi:hypothetical protein
MLPLLLGVWLATAWAAPDDMASLFLLHRHGDRAPIDTISTTPSVFAQQWPLGAGELTAHGMLQLYRLGQQLRTTYSFLPKQFNPLNHYVRSTDLHRTLQSATSLLYGFYAGQGPIDPLCDPAPCNQSLPYQFQPVPISTVPTTTDSLLLGWDWGTDNCYNVGTLSNGAGAPLHKHTYTYIHIYIHAYIHT